MPITGYDYYIDYSGITPVDPYTNADYTVFDGTLRIITSLPSGNALTNSSGDGTNVLRFGYTADTHLDSAKVGVARAYPNDGSDSTVAVTLGSSGAGYNFSTSLGTETCYAARWLGDSVQIFRFVSGTGTQVGPSIFTQTPVDGDEFVLEMVRGGSSDTIRVLINDVNVVEYTDNSPITFSGNVASVSFKGLDNLNSSFYGFAVDSLSGSSITEGLPAYTLHKDGVALGNLTNVKVRVTATSALDGTEYYYDETVSATAGVLPAIDLSATAATVGDTVTVEILHAGTNEGAVFEDLVEDIS